MHSRNDYYVVYGFYPVHFLYYLGTPSPIKRGETPWKEINETVMISKDKMTEYILKITDAECIT